MVSWSAFFCARSKIILSALENFLVAFKSGKTASVSLKVFVFSLNSNLRKALKTEGANLFIRVDNGTRNCAFNVAFVCFSARSFLLT